jgi:hypothetical protein
MMLMRKLLVFFFPRDFPFCMLNVDFFYVELLPVTSHISCIHELHVNYCYFMILNVELGIVASYEINICLHSEILTSDDCYEQKS